MTLPKILLAAFIWSALCSYASSAQQKAICVLKTRDADSDTLALQGFKDEIKKRGISAAYREYSLKDEGAVERINAQRPDLILTLGTSATKELIEKVKDIPAVFSLVLDPRGSSLKAENLTGASLDIPLEVQFSDLKTVLPGKKKIGVAYSKENREIVDKAKKTAGDLGLTLKTYQVNSPKDIPKIQEMGIDVLWLIPDVVVCQSAIVTHLLLDGLKHGIPIIGISLSYVKAGALLALSCDYEDIGRQTAEIASKVLAGAKPADIPFSVPRKSNVYVNAVVAERLGIRIGADIGSERLRMIGE